MYFIGGIYLIEYINIVKIIIYIVIVYVLKIESENKYKIGYTKRKLEKRLKELIEPVWYFESRYVTKLESYLHRYFKHKKIEGEWFILEDSDIDIIKKECLIFESRIDYLLESGNPFSIKEFTH